MRLPSTTRSLSPELHPGEMMLICTCGAEFSCRQPGCAELCPRRSYCGDESSFVYTPPRDGFESQVARCPACGNRRSYSRSGYAVSF